MVLKDVEESLAWDQRPAFTDAQLSVYFASLGQFATEEPPMLWVPMLMLYAGLRTEEAAKLEAEDVREVDGILCIDVNPRTGRLKTKNAPRVIPVHPAIAPQLRAYAAAHPSGNLWGLERNRYGVYSASLSKRLNRQLDLACPEDTRLVTYSLRHTFATRLKHLDVSENVLDELLGHKVEKLGMNRYGKKYKVDKLRDAVQKLAVPVNTCATKEATT